jgi:hypothetical protein
LELADPLDQALVKPLVYLPSQALHYALDQPLV